MAAPQIDMLELSPRAKDRGHGGQVVVAHSEERDLAELSNLFGQAGDPVLAQIKMLQAR